MAVSTGGSQSAFAHDRAGTPSATAPAGTSCVTTAPAPITAFRPIRTPSVTIAPAPSQTPSSMTMPVALSPCA